MRKWILKVLNGVPRENITLVNLLKASTLDEANKAVGEVYHSHIYRHPLKKSNLKQAGC